MCQHHAPARARRRRPSTRSCALAALLTVAVVAAACSSGGSRQEATTPRGYGVGVRSETIENSTPSLAQPSNTSAGSRVLETTIFYPATGPSRATAVPNASPARSGPFPLVVFAHGLGGNPAYAQALLVAWARAGYVVAAPRFPKTSDTAAGGPDPGDFVNQPGDVTAVADAMLQMTKATDDPLAGTVGRGPIGVAGHSLGGITTLGVAANTCCADRRIGAAVVLSGDPLSFPGGTFDYAHAPPLLLVHGTADDLVPYEASVDVFNAARGPKALLTVRHGDHGAPVSASGASFATIVRTTVDFFDAYLKQDASARARLVRDGSSATTRFVVAAKPGARTTIPTTPAKVRHLEATVTPDHDLVDGQTVTVSWRGFTPGKTINIVQCSNRTAGDSAACDLQKGRILQPDPTGTGSLPLEIVVGPVGNGTCDAQHADCQIVVNDGGSLDPAASVRIPVSFAPT